MMEGIVLFAERFAELPKVIIAAFCVVAVVIIGGPRLIERVIIGTEKRMLVIWRKIGDGGQEFVKWCGLTLLGILMLFAFLGVGQNACHSGSTDCGYYEER
jgi:hypothetical protein